MTYSITQATDPDNLKTWLEFVAKIAWPITVVLVVAMFRGRISRLADKLTKAEGPGFALSFEATADQIAASADAQKAKTIGADAPPAPEDPFLKSLNSTLSGVNTVEFAPIAIGTVVTAWARLEEVLRERAKQADPAGGMEFMSITGVIRRLSELGIVSPDTAQLIDKARRLRNSAVHRSEELTPDSVRSFVEMAGRIEALLR